MFLMAIAWLFGIPAFYLAKSKGRSGFGYCASTILLGLVGMVLGPLGLGLPLGALGALWLLPARPGAPGKGYMRITFACPECGSTVTFPRHREGVADLCPNCGEVIHVPTDQHSPKPLPRQRRKPDAPTGEICFDSFGREDAALTLAAALCERGVPARVADGSSGANAFFGASEGYRVYIPAQHWDAAVRAADDCACSCEKHAGVPERTEPA